MDVLNAIETSLDNVAEPYRGLYTEREGKFELTGVTGFKTQADIDRLQGALVKERNDHKTVRDRLGLFGDLDPEQIHAKLDRIDELEAAAGDKIDENKLNEMVETRLKTKLAPVERQLNTVVKERDDLVQVVGQYQEKERIASIHSSIRDGAGKTKVLPEAVEDALLLAERVFEVNEDGSVTAKDGMGCTPGITPEIWFQELQSLRPHWWGPSQGGGARPGGGGNTGNNPWASETWNMTEQNRIYRENPQRAQQLARSAGTSIGGLQPVKSA